MASGAAWLRGPAEDAETDADGETARTSVSGPGVTDAVPAGLRSAHSGVLKAGRIAPPASELVQITQTRTGNK